MRLPLHWPLCGCALVRWYLLTLLQPCQLYWCGNLGLNRLASPLGLLPGTVAPTLTLGGFLGLANPTAAMDAAHD